MAPEPFPRNEKNRCPPVLVQLVGTPIPKKGRASGEATLDATRAGESSLRPGVEQAWSKMMQKSIYIIYIYIRRRGSQWHRPYVDLSIGYHIYIYILLSNDLGQRDASDIPIWLPPGLSHVP